MITLADRYNAKVLLFGEYTVLDGSAAVAIPLASKYGRWGTGGIKNSSDGIKLLKSHLTQLYYKNEISGIDFDRLELDLSRGLSFDSTIPIGYGLGSSGALTAAFYDRYFHKSTQLSLTELRSVLATVEGAFHGSSSGLDPLVSLLNMPLLVHPDGDVELLDCDRSVLLAKCRLVDTGMSRSTAALVQAYKHTRKESQEFKTATEAIADITDSLIAAYVLGHYADYEQLYRQLSMAQLHTLTMLIPKKYVELWQQGQEEQAFYMKLCGAGGGGCLLLHVVDEGKTADILQSESMISIS